MAQLSTLKGEQYAAETPSISSTQGKLSKRKLDQDENSWRSLLAACFGYGKANSSNRLTFGCIGDSRPMNCDNISSQRNEERAFDCRCGRRFRDASLLHRHQQLKKHEDASAKIVAKNLLQILSILECHQGHSVKIIGQWVEPQRTIQREQWFSWDDYQKLDGASDALEEYL
ncbi:hypothetical protein EJ02DRAFT_516677 [Clathrospora elynae]|uniref:C2H2-type domain-containing protein n=1 Tax=Clathrospora elynae TaxID=706981 RepID=A0A6A5S5J1_9PLEO|nr:hypothetical protein EJ02DRAFT_516677 [Clathrospora elynae]